MSRGQPVSAYAGGSPSRAENACPLNRRRKYFEAVTRRHSAPATQQKLAAIRMLFDWRATGLIVPANPAATVRGPKRVVKVGKTPRTSQAGLCDGALIGLMV